MQAQLAFGYHILSCSGPARSRWRPADSIDGRRFTTNPWAVLADTVQMGGRLGCEVDLWIAATTPLALARGGAAPASASTRRPKRHTRRVASGSPVVHVKIGLRWKRWGPRTLRA